MDTIVIDTPGQPHAVNLHPVVLLTILDHHVRRDASQDRVIGGLLGTYVNGVYEVTNAFGVYFTIQFNQQKNEDELLVRRQTLLDMIELHRKVNPKEVLVGWFSTWTGAGAAGAGDGASANPHIDDFALVVHREIIADAAAKKGGVAHPILLLLDCSLRTPKFAMHAYLPVPNAMLANLLVQFRQLRTSLVASTEERVAVEAMTRHALGGGGPGGVATPVGEARPLGGDVDALDASVRRVHALLDSVCAYVDDVVEGRRPGDEATGRAIAEALAAVPRGVGDAAAAAGGLDGTSPAARATQDVLMVSYLASLAQRQIELAERVSQMTPAVRVPPPA